MVTLAATVHKVLGFVADDEITLPELARACASDAEQLWAHHGGDSGGW